jgi:ferrous iron transport protein B
MVQAVALAGNPNVGKTSLFNLLTGTRHYVGNWPGVTVEKKEGRIKGLSSCLLIDLPGIYSLSAQSVEEQVAISYLLLESPSVILNIVDASNLERNLYLTVQLLEMGLPSVMVLNMVDVAVSRGIQIDQQKLAQKLGVPVIPMVVRKGKGRQHLIERLEKQEIPRSRLIIPYPEPVERAIDELTILLDSARLNWTASTRWLATMWLERNETIEHVLRQYVDPSVIERMTLVRQRIGDTAYDQIRSARYAWIETLLKEVSTQRRTVERTWSDRIDNLLLNRFLGIPLFLLFMFLVFQITYSWVGTSLSDQLDTFISGPVTDWMNAALTRMGSPDWFTQLMIGGVLAGVGSVLVFVPQIAILFLCLSFLEDSGYMARAAILMDRLMMAIGLNGKAFIPLILGFGCNVPAIMATRTLEDHKVRMVTALIAPFMSCSARLSVYSLFVAAFFPKGQAEVVFLLYLTGILMAIGTASLFKKFLKADDGMFLMELPPYRAPMLTSLLLHTWDKTKGFVRKAGTIIFGMSVLIWFLGNFSWHGVTEMNHSFLAAIGGFIAPLFAPMGFGTWQAGVSLITGFLAKEVVVSTMSIVYGAGDTTGSLSALLQGAFTPAAALSFLFFVLLYTPCVSTVAALKRETGSWKWTLISVVYSAAVAWVISFVVYQAAEWVY